MNKIIAIFWTMYTTATSMLAASAPLIWEHVYDVQTWLGLISPIVAFIAFIYSLGQFLVILEDDSVAEVTLMVIYPIIFVISFVAAVKWTEGVCAALFFVLAFTAVAILGILWDTSLADNIRNWILGPAPARKCTNYRDTGYYTRPPSDIEPIIGKIVYHPNTNRDVW